MPEGDAGGPDDDRLADLLSEVWHADTMASSPRTRLFLAAGEKLLHSGLARLPGESPAIAGGASRAPFDELLAWISRRRVVAKAQQSESSYRYRWRTQTGYLRDLVIFALRSRMASPEETKSAQRVLAEGRPLDEAIDQIARDEVMNLHNDKAFRLQMVFQAILSDDVRVADALRRIDDTNLQAWQDFYKTAMDGLGIRLRDGVTLDDFAQAMQAAADGVVFRSLLAGRSGDQDPSRSLGLIAMALVVAFADHGDGKDLRRAVCDVPRAATRPAEAVPDDGATP